MKLFMYCCYCRRKIYLASQAKTRNQLAAQWGNPFNLKCPHCRRNGLYLVEQVYAEKSTQNSSLPIAVIGGLIGLLGGPVGALAGGAIGGLVGKTADDKEVNEVVQFNRSKAFN